MPLILPDITQRVTINGRTGSGKSQMAAWLTSIAPIDRFPYVVIDFKREKLFNAIERARYIEPLDVLPKQSEGGLYIMQLMPGDDNTLETWLERVLHRGNIGLVFDEAGQISHSSRMFRALLTMGRSLHIPMTIVSQRPAWLPRWVFSEADFYSLFKLNDKRDRDTVAQFTPDENDEPIWQIKNRLPSFHSLWYDVGRDFSALLKPCPDRNAILQAFDDKLKPRRNWL